MPSLVVRNLQKSYGKKEVLTGISASYQSGLIHGIVGENGSGKTTLFRCFAGLLPHEGSIEYKKPDCISFLPAELHTYPFISGLEFVRFCLAARKKSFDETKLHSLNAFLQLPLNEYAENYSTGMLKKLYLMAILLQDDEVILLDEPFNGLDVSTTIFITEILKKLAQNGRTIFVSSHIIQHLTSFSHSISWINNGKLHYFESDYSQMIESMTESIKFEIDSLAIFESK